MTRMSRREGLKARQENPKKQWKITDEDWRNREKWDQYEGGGRRNAGKETSIPHAPWIVVEGNDKYYARIKVLECVTEAIEKRLKKREKIKMTIREQMEEREKEYLSPLCHIKHGFPGRKRNEPQCDIRPVFRGTEIGSCTVRHSGA